MSENIACFHLQQALFQRIPLRFWVGKPNRPAKNIRHWKTDVSDLLGKCERFGVVEWCMDVGHHQN